MSVTLSGTYLQVGIDANGLQSCVLAKKHNTISSGGLGLVPGNGISPLRSATISGTTNVLVTHNYDNLSVYYTYSIYNHDIRLSIKVTNNSDTPFSALTFNFPTFNFSRNASGNMHSWHWTYYTSPQNIPNCYHPGLWSPTAANYAHDDTWGVCIHSKSHFYKPTLVNAQFQADGIIPAQCQPALFITDAVPPHSSYTINVNFRIIDNLSLPILIGAYLTDYAAIVGPLQYVPDDRPLVCSWPEDGSWVTPDSPLGLNRRVDTPDGVVAMQDMLSPAIGLAQGTMWWQPQAYNPRGCAYRPDFDVWPPTIVENLPTLIQWANANGLSFGLCARPAQLIQPINYTTDGTYDLYFDNPSQMGMLLNRFQNVINYGVSSFYLDSMGIDLNSYEIMKQIRAAVGPNVRTYSEYTSDIMLPYSGLYSEVMDGSGNTRWYSAETLSVFRMIQPKSSIIAKDLSTPDPTTGLTTVTMDVYGKNKLSPIVIDFMCGTMVSQYQYLLATYFNGKNWK